MGGPLYLLWHQYYVWYLFMILWSYFSAIAVLLVSAYRCRRTAKRRDAERLYLWRLMYPESTYQLSKRGV